MTTLFYALVLALVWVAIVGTPTPWVFGIGFAGGLAVVALLRPPPLRIQLRHLPGQLVALLKLVASLYRDILLSGLTVTRQILSRDMRLKTGIVAISTKDAKHDPLILALSANYITLTPGELVVAVRDDHMMYVHCLDVDASAAVIEAAQAKRLGLLRRILREMR